MATPIPKNRATFTLAEIARATRGTVARRASEEPAVGVTTDSRAVTDGSAFVALRGESHDGHAFVSAAAERGARVVVVERRRQLALPSDTSVVEVDDTLLAWGDLAGAHLVKWRAASPAGRVVAITGSAGKTTTKELTAALLAEIAPTHFTAGNLNNRVGVPAVVFGLGPEHRFCVLEMGMSLPGELDAITAFARPDVSVIVNVGVAHAEGVGGRDGVMHEKGAVYRALGPDGVAVVNVDDAYVLRAAALAGARRFASFGRGEVRPELGDAPHYRLLARVPEDAGRRGEPAGSRVVVSSSGSERALRLPIPGEAAALDLVAALAAEEAASGDVLPVSVIERALARVHLSGRGTIRTLAGDVLLLDDTYNANPASMRAALATLAEIGAGRRKVAVLGEMKELGSLAASEHEALGDAVADAGVALAIGCGGLVEHALDRAAARGVVVVRAASTEEAAREALRYVEPRDAVLAKGSRSVEVERVVDALAGRVDETDR